MNFHHFTRYLLQTGKEFVSLLSLKLLIRAVRYKKPRHSCNLFENASRVLFFFAMRCAIIQNMANKQFDRPKSGIRIRPRYIILFFILTFFVLGGVFLSQQTKLKSIAEDKVALQAELDSRKVEQERLERMLEYMQTTEYLVQYAREKLGYVFPDDWKFYDTTTETEKNTAQNAGDLPIGTPQPTVTPTPHPTPSPTPWPAPWRASRA